MTRRSLLALPFATRIRAERAGEFRRITAWPDPTDALLGVESLRARVEGQPAKVLRARGPGDDLVLLLVLDMVGDLSRIDPARQALSAEISELPATTWVAVMRSQDGLRVLTDPTAERQKVIQAISGAQISGRAGLLETIEPAASLATGLLVKTTLRVAVIYVSDSDIHNYREDYTNPVINPSDYRDLSRRFPEGLVREKSSKLAATLAAYDAPVFIVHLAFLRDRLNEAYQNGLQAMADATGGSATFCRSPADIPGEIAQAFKRIRSHWAIDFETPDSAPRTFVLELTNGDLPLRYRARFARAK